MVTCQSSTRSELPWGLLALCRRTLGSERHRYAIAWPDELGADPIAYGNLNEMDAAAEIGRNPVSKRTRFSLSMHVDWAGWRGTGRSNLSRETKISGANGDREIAIFPIQLTTSKKRRIGNLTGRFIHTLSTCPLYTNSGYGKREAHINWSMMTCKMAAPVTGTTLRTTGPMPADSRQWTLSVRNCVTR